MHFIGYLLYKLDIESCEFEEYNFKFHKRKEKFMAVGTEWKSNPLKIMRSL